MGGTGGGIMPVKVRELKAMLSRAGFDWRPAKGSHTYWTHPLLPDFRLSIAGKDGQDAEKYQIRAVKDALRKIGERK
jgi:predicted RNA binding protein YcfA (HicA-like mRNA interferase family)